MCLLYNTFLGRPPGYHAWLCQVFSLPICLLMQVVRRLAIAAAWLSGLYTFLLAIVGVGVCAGDEDYTQYCGALRIM